MMPRLLAMVLLAATSGVAAGVALTRTFCDVKTALNDGTLNETNVDALLSSLSSLMHCNGVRIPLLPTLASPSQYSSGYNATIVAARARNLTLYASPMEGAWSAVPGGEAGYVAWVARYATAYGPHFLSVFNEVGAQNCDPACMARVVKAVRGSAGVPSYIGYVGPDDEHVDSTLKACKGAGDFKGVFHVLSSHNAGQDSSATPAAWAQLVAAGAGRDVWSSENPACFNLTACTKYSTLADPIGAGVAGLVTWATLGNDVTLAGAITAQGADIAGGLPALAEAADTRLPQRDF